MTYVSPEKKVLPAPGDTYSYTDEQRAFAASVRDVVPVTNRGEADSIAAAMATDGRPITDSNPLIVFNNETKNVEIRDSSGWRPMVATPPMGHVGQTSGAAILGTGAYVPMDTAQILRGGVTFSNGADALIVPVSGLYRFNIQAHFSGGSGYTGFAQLRKNAVATGIYAAVYKPDGWDYKGSTGGILQLAANDSMTIWMETSTNNASAYTWGTTGHNGTFLEVEMIGV